MSYERGYKRGQRASKYGVAVGVLTLLYGLLTEPSHVFYWFLAGGVTFFSASVTVLVLIYLTEGGIEKK